MSQAVKVAMLASRDLPKTERLVVLAIAAHANAEGNSWPSVATIADYVGCSVRTVQRCLAKLVQLGRLVVSKVGHVATRVYRLVTGQQQTPGVTDSAPGVTQPGPGGDIPSVSPEEVPEDQKKNYRAAARDWRQWLKPKTATPQRQPHYPERRGAALPADRGAQCPRHLGEAADNCRCCRSEALGGVA
jgi:DNA-binding transcriptional MocR family regulator